MHLVDKIQYLNHIIEILEKFQEHPNSNFNFSKLAKYFKLKPNEAEKLLDIVFQFQKIFNSKLNGYVLTKKRKDNTIYLNLIDKSKVYDYNQLESHEIQLSKQQTSLLSDIIYYFQHIKIGKGFDIRYNDSELIRNVKFLSKAHPYLFEHRNNGLIYPSRLAISIGDQILSCNRGNKPPTELAIDEYVIKIKEGEET